MGNVFSGIEIVEIGVQIERNGMDFYNEVAASSRSPKAKKIFLFLAGEEHRHISIFQMIMNSVENYEPSGAYPEEYFAYMNTLASGHVFTEKDRGSEIAKTAKSDIEAVDLGIGFEKDSIEFYEGMKKVVPEHDHGLVEELIRQERDHLGKLTEIKKEL